MKVVIIGNAPSLIGSNLGKKIDRCSKIVRFNDFRIQGFEKDLGSRTTHWCVAHHSVYNLLYRQAGKCDANSGAIEELWMNGVHFNLDGNIVQFLLRYAGVSNDDIRFYSEKVWAKYEKRFGTIPSTGFMGVMTAREAFPKAEIFIAGFGDGGGHYYNKEHKKGRHNFEAEYTEYEHFVKHGNLKWL